MKSNNKERINFELSKELFEELLNCAKQQELSYSAVLRLALREYLDKFGINTFSR